MNSPAPDPASLLVLWDIDGTLIYNGGVSKEAYAAGFTALTGRALEHPVITDCRDCGNGATPSRARRRRSPHSPDGLE
jgi:hypothetical protein